MKTSIVRVLMLIISVAGQSLAHHSLIGYDQSKIVTIRGKVSSIEWVNPHAAITVTVENRDGISTRLAIDMASPRALQQRGIDKSFVKIGDVVSVDVFLLSVPASGAERDASNGRRLTSADGRQFDISDNWPSMPLPVR